MASRFYLQASGSPGATPAIQESWDDTAQSDSRPMNMSKQSTAFATKAVTETANGPVYVLNRQYVSEPLEAYTFSTITDTISFHVRCLESAAQANCTMWLYVGACSGDGNTIRGTIFSAFISTTEWDATNLENRGDDDVAVTGNIALQNGDRLILEIGILFNNTKTNPMIGTQDFGDNSGTDLPEDETDQNQYNPWFETNVNLSPYAPFVTLAGTMSASGALSSVVLSVLREIQGEISAAGTFSADMKAFRGLAGEIAANAILVGDISIGALILLAGEISSTATLSGTIKRGRGIAGEIASAAILSGNLKADRKLAGEIDAAAILSAALKRTRGLEGEIAGVATLSADITIAGAILLAGTIAATGTLSGTAKVLRGLSGNISAQAVFTALLTLGAEVLLQGTISATGLLTGNLSALRKMSGDIAASGDFEAVLSAAKSISGLIDANAVLSGELRPFRGLAGEISGQSAFSAVLQLFRGLAGEIDAAGTLEGDLKIDRGLAGEIDAQATLEALFKKTAGLSGEIDAQATFTGILQLLGVAITTIVMEGWLEKYPGIEAVFDKTLLWKAFLERYGATEGQLKDD